MPRPVSSGGCGGRGGPCCGSRSSEGPEGLSGDQVSLEIEDVVDGAMGGDEALGLALRLETLHFALASTDREMGVLNPVVFAQSARLVTALALQHLQCGGVRSEAVGNECVGNEALVLEKFSERFQGRRLVAALLYHHFFEVPDAVDPGASFANVSRNRGTELVRPTANGLVSDVDAARGKQFLDVSQAEGETEREPHRLADDIRQETVPLVGNSLHHRLLNRDWLRFA